jgi:regulator of protease activity HflC (stomatin/prohibitin superfamily)
MATKQQQAALDPLVNEAFLQYQAEVERLRAQLAAQQAVVDAARQAVRGRMGGYVALREALRAFDKAQAAQPEGEWT